MPIVRYETRDNPGHYCRDGYRTESTMTSFSPDDERARRILAGSGMRFELVDLSNGSLKKRLAAWTERIRETPTLLVEHGRRGRYEGVKAIFDYVEGQRKIVAAGNEVNVG